jgi:hypothetical protein
MCTPAQKLMEKSPLSPGLGIASAVLPKAAAHPGASVVAGKRPVVSRLGIGSIR